MSHSPIAMIGMACRFPGGESPEAFWELLCSGTDAIQPIPPERFELPGRHFAGQLSELGGFDPDYFGVTPTEAASMDLQQRLMLELGVEALHDAGLASEGLRGKKVGVFIGVSSVDYTHSQLLSLDQVNMYTITGAATSVIANRLSYFFDFHGPSMVVDTACSSALTALHLALQSLRNGQAEMVLVGGVNILLSPLLQQGFEEAQALAPDGKCKTFDAAADGMVRGEGAGLVVLKPLAQAQVDQDRIYAVIYGCGLSQDGQTNGLSAPSPAGQRRSLQAACSDAGIDPAHVSYVEAHGTGTPLGDPIEARALGEVYGQARLNSGLSPLKIGSVKTQIGHLEAAAGIAGLLKTCLSLYHRQLPPSLHFQTPNPHIPFAKWHLEVVTQLEPWQQVSPLAFGIKPSESIESPPKRSELMGVSAFGFGGTNVHVLLGPAPSSLAHVTTGQTDNAKEQTTSPQLLPLSAHSPAALAQRAADLSTWLETRPELPIGDLQYSLALRQSQAAYRVGLVFENARELQTELKALATDAEGGHKTLKKSARKLVFLFSGMGSQEKGMGQQLLSEPVFVARLKEIDEVLRPLTGFSVQAAVENGYQDKPEIVQPVLFALQLALFALWQSWGLRPDALMGTSMGEISAACAGGWLSLEDAALIVVKRIGQLKSRVGSGAMGIVGLPAKAVESRLQAMQPCELWVAGLNGPELTVVSGQEQALENFLSTLQDENIFARRVKGADAPSHSPMMEPLKTPLLESLSGIVPQVGQIPVYSTVTPSTQAQTDFGPDYWWQNLRQAVKLQPAFEIQLAAGTQVFVEISPHPVLTTGLIGLGDSHLLPSLRRDQPSARPLFESLGILYSLGFEIHWSALIGPNPHLISLPLYPWQRIPCWLEAAQTQPQTQPQTPLPRSPLATRLNSVQHSHPVLSAEMPGREGLIGQLQRELGSALRLDPAMLNPSEPLKHLGIGSLVGMELFSRLKKKFGVKLPLAQFLQGPSLEEIADMILSGLQAQLPSPERLRPDKLPLSFAQTRFWLLEQLQPSQRTHFIPVALEIIGPLDVQALQTACQSVIQRHEILRTVYRQDEKGQPFQRVLAAPPSCWEVIVSPPLETSACQEMLKTHARQPFDWQNAPPLRFSLFVFEAENNITQPAERFVLLLSLHHIVADGLSFRVLFQELQAVYTALIQAETAKLPELTWQYADFALWQRDQLATDPSLKADLAYWQTALAEAPVQTPLPYDSPRRLEASLQEAPGAQAPFQLPEETHLALENLAKTSGKSLFSLLLTGFYLLLWKFAESDDLVVGTPVAGRLEAETQDLIGPFLNMLPLRMKMDPEQNLAALFDHVQNVVHLALEHQATPFEQMVEVLQPPRIPGLHPLFQTVLALHGEIGFAPLGECILRPLELDIGVARFDLAFTLIPEQGTLKGSVEYNCQLFGADTVQNLITLWLSILAELPKLSPHLPLKNWQIPGGQQILAPEWFPAQKVPTRLLPLLAGESDMLALIDLQEKVALRWSYRELWQRARVIAQNVLYLTGSQGRVSPSAPPWVAVCLPRGGQSVAAWLGILLADKVYVPLDPDSPPERLTTLLSSLHHPLLICLPETAEQLKAHFALHNLASPQTLSPDAALSLACDLPEPSQTLSNLIFTSGTSGQPKAVKVTQAGMANLINWHLKTFPSQPGEGIPQTAHISFDAAGWEIWSGLAAGATLLFWDRNTLLDPQELQSALLNQEIRQLFLPTPLAALLLQLPWPTESELTCLRTGGDRLPPFQPDGLPFTVWNHYGPSECSVVACAGPIKTLSPGQPPALGQLLPGLQAQICDPFGHVLPWGFPGQLTLSGIGLSPGYIDSEADATTYSTGDRLRYIHGQFHFLGRSDRQFKFKGVRIEAAEIEATLLRHSGVSSAALLATEQRLWAFYTGQIAPAELKTWLEQQLPPSLVPAQLILLERLPETERGKVDYLALHSHISKLENSTSDPLASAPQQPAHMGLEKRIKELWQDILGQAVHAESDFFALGGHSLLAVQMVMQLRQQSEHEIGLHQLFAHPRLEDFVRAVKAAPLRPASLPQIHPQPELVHAPFPLTSVQAAYWVGRQTQMTLGGVGAQACLELELSELDHEKLEKALNQLICRHPMLRTVITDQGQQQVLAALPDYQIEYHDLRNEPTEVQTGKLQALRQESLAAVFDPHQWPLFELKLTPHAGGTRLHLRLDALIADATSFLLLGHELDMLYHHPESGLPQLDLNFGDYMRTLTEIRKSPAFLRDRDYWQTRLLTLPEAPILPLSKAPEQLKALKFERLSLSVNNTYWETLKSTVQAHKITPNSLVLGLFAAILSYWSENDSFIINLTTFQRLPLHPQVNQLVGDFTSLNLLEIPVRQGKLVDWVAQIQQQLWQDLEHHLYSGVEVLRDLRQHNHSGTAPVVFTGLLGQNLPALPLGAEWVFAQTQTPQVWLDCQASESEGGLQVNWDFLVELFPPGLPQAMFEAFEQLLHHLAKHPADWQAPFNQSWVLGSQGKPEQTSTRLSANATASAIAPQCLHRACLDQALAHPFAPALKSPERHLSYAQLLAEASALARKLLEQGLQQAEPVAIVMHKGWEQAVAVLGILLAGGAYLPIEAHLPPERIAALLRLGQAKKAVVQASFVADTSFLQQAKMSWIPVLQPPEPLPLPDQAEISAFLKRTSPEQLAYVIFTSGSTGQPKGVMIAHAAAWNTVAAINHKLNLTADDRIWGLSSLSFDLSVYDLFGTWAAGACLVLPAAQSGRDPDMWLTSLIQDKITLWNSVPALMQLLIEFLERSPEVRLPALRQVLLSGDWIPLALPPRIATRAPQAQMWSLGGATEASIWSNIHPITLPLPADWNSIPYGKPLANQRFEVFNSQMEACPEWVAGELCISGSGLALGYWQDTEKTKERFVYHPQTGERWYKTGDRGRYRPGGILEFLGRRDNQVKIQGYRIELGEIESCLRTHPHIADALVTAPYQGNEREKRSLCAYYISREALASAELETYLAERLPAWMVPHQWLAMDTFPLNSSGKPDRKQLPTIVSEEPKPATTMAQNQIETQLQRLFHEVLEINITDPQVDLLSLGVNSIDLIRLGNRLQQEFGLAPGVGEMFQLRSLRQLAQYYSSRPATKNALPPTRLSHFAEKKLPPRQISGQDTFFAPPQSPPESENWKSSRQFLSEPCTRSELAELLTVLAEYPGPHGPRYLYPSAGGVYPLLVYLQVNPERIAGLGAGLYYYDAHQHKLVQLSSTSPSLSTLHLPNSREMAQAAAFSLYLVADLAGMTARYGSDARDYCLIEAGAMVQLLREQASRIGLGLCSVSQIDDSLLRIPCTWLPGDECLHSLVGGRPGSDQTQSPISHSEVNTPPKDEEWEEWVF